VLRPRLLLITRMTPSALHAFEISSPTCPSRHSFEIRRCILPKVVFSSHWNVEVSDYQVYIVSQPEEINTSTQIAATLLIDVKVH